ncbi:hypothetical protein [Nannocystis sp.]|uniref:hypothetical protein n=1 Tax=Nannocystis sp. TaxID=1962667 RepID=UPI0024295878|nr:hypothetical protein [Nannocystis sp.]MBK7830714.1 hypothetical protein [Nannocystis sp.]MBK9756246.1 hypothetical protein [Nannocystis sp.]
MRTLRIKLRLRARHAVLLAVSAAGCGSDGGGEPPGTFTEIFETLFPPTTNARCNFCHSMPASDISNGNLSTGMDQASAYAALIDVVSTSSRCGGKPLVVPFHPEESLFLDKLMGKPTCGDRMPLGGMALSESELEVVRSWIEAGAKDD